MRVRSNRTSPERIERLRCAARTWSRGSKPRLERASTNGAFTDRPRKRRAIRTERRLLRILPRVASPKLLLQDRIRDRTSPHEQTIETSRWQRPLFSAREHETLVVFRDLRHEARVLPHSSLPRREALLGDLLDAALRLHCDTCHSLLVSVWQSFRAAWSRRQRRRLLRRSTAARGAGSSASSLFAPCLSRDACFAALSSIRLRPGHGR